MAGERWVILITSKYGSHVITQLDGYFTTLYDGWWFLDKWLVASEEV